MMSRLLPAALLPLLLLGGCPRGPADEVGAISPAADAPAPTNRIDIPPSVRQNLGITFARAEARRVEATLRAPGRFEYLADARREYRTMLPGRIEMLVGQFDQIDEGAPLYRIDSTAWRSIQQQLSDAGALIDRLSTRLGSFGPLREAHRNHESELEETIDIRQQLVEQLESVAEAGGGRRADLIAARDALSVAKAELAEVLEKEAELEANESVARSDREAAITSRAFLLDSAASLLRMTASELEEEIEGPSGPRPRWRDIEEILVRAEAPGIVESLGLTNGAWADEKTTVLTVVQPTRLRFRATGLQSDLGRLRDGLLARIVAPSPTSASGAISIADTMSGTLTLGLNGDADDRTLDLFVVPETLASWARAGISAQLEIVTDAAAAPVLAIPKAAVQRDGLVPVIFRRDPANPNQAIRIEADLGLDDGRWVVVNSELRLQDEVVLDGAFQLMLATATAGGQPQGGHFHADGTFHAGDDH